MAAYINPKLDDPLELEEHGHEIKKVIGWGQLNQMESVRDEFDRKDTIYITAKNKNKYLVGSVRLFEISKPCPLNKYFHVLLNDVNLDQGERIWELSKLSTVDFDYNNQKKINPNDSPVAISLIHEAVSRAAQSGIGKLITVASLSLERLMSSVQLEVHRVAPPIVVGSYPLVACWIECRANSSFI